MRYINRLLLLRHETKAQSGLEGLLERLCCLYSNGWSYSAAAAGTY